MPPSVPAPMIFDDTKGWLNHPGFIVVIRKNDTGESVNYEEPYYVHQFHDDDDRDRDFLHYGFSEYMWGAGNYSCDCNRELFWARTKGVEEPEHTGFCIGKGQYTVTAVYIKGEPDKIIWKDPERARTGGVTDHA